MQGIPQFITQIYAVIIATLVIPHIFATKKKEKRAWSMARYLDLEKSREI